MCDSTLNQSEIIMISSDSEGESSNVYNNWIIPNIIFKEARKVPVAISIRLPIQ